MDGERGEVWQVLPGPAEQNSESSGGSWRLRSACSPLCLLSHGIWAGIWKHLEIWGFGVYSCPKLGFVSPPRRETRT